MKNLVLDHEFEAFASRKSFNRNLKHFKAVNSIIPAVESGENLAQFVSGMIQAGDFEPIQILPLLNAILVEKYHYAFCSINLVASNANLSVLATEFQSWKAVDLVFVYHHPESGILLLNPKNAIHWANVSELKKNELLMAYIGLGNDVARVEEKQFRQAVKAVSERLPFVLGGSNKGKLPAVLAEGNFAFKEEKKPSEPKRPALEQKPRARKAGSSKPVSIEPVAASPQTQSAAEIQQSQPAVARQVVTSSGRMTVSPKIPIQVTNELFHNGNVEAWKRIIESYRSRYPQCKVNVYYDGELIHDINSLFKWGKVKHGTSILVSLATPDEKLMDLSKLRKYLLEGASPRFEFFLKGAPGKTLELF